MPTSADLKFEPAWLRRLSRAVLANGALRSVTAITLGVMVIGVGVAQLLLTLIGHGDRRITTGIALGCTLLVTPPLSWGALRLVYALEHARKQVAVLATRDELTGLHNRRHFMTLVEAEWDRAKRYGHGAAMLLIDVDHFKLVNDGHGHLCGDELLRRIASATGELLRQPDVLARFGGEEFVIFLPHTDTLGAVDVAERIRERVRGLVLEWEGRPVTVSVSIGVAPLRTEMPSIDFLLHEADTALYTAKADGRNCVRSIPLSALRRGSISTSPQR
ncbi:MAG: GGDEF domain-containing protein [Burkholderiaceae bacterium]